MVHRGQYLLKHCLGCVFVLFVLVSVSFCVVVDIQDIHIVSPSTAEVYEECYGTHNGLSVSGSPATSYERMRSRYSGCTHVIGNLEITHLGDESIDYDLSFLQDIRYVSGYVLIALVTQVPEIPLHSLEIIRGNYTFPLMNDDYALALFLNYPKSDKSAGLRELQLPSLKEITNGKVGFQGNPSLGFVNTIDWDVIVRHRPNGVELLAEPYNNASVSSTDLTSGCPSGRMWARGFCQSDVRDIQCHATCDGRCFGTGSGECCHATCAVGCHGSSNQDCTLCKDYQYNFGCVGFCPAMTHPEAQNCMAN